MTEKKKGIAKSLRKAALVVFGGAALLGAGVGIRHEVRDFTAPAVTAPVVAAQEMSNLPQGDGHPVLVIPGFMTGDAYMAPLRGRIEGLGYKVYGWGAGVNTGASADNAKHLADLLQKISAENGGQKVSLVGYSLGGVYARELARAHPELVRDVITLSAPFGQQPANGAPDEIISRIHSYYGLPGNDVVTPPPVPTTAISSRNDFIVYWRDSQNPAGGQSENIAVNSGHILMPFNRAVAGVVLERLSQKQDAWQAYRNSGNPSAP